jgi:hypothetical protein
MHIIYNILSIALITLLLFCSEQDKTSSQKVAELEFEIDSSKVEHITHNTDLGIQFNSPKGWTLIPQALFEEFSKRNSAIFLEGVDFTINPISIFLNKENKSLLYISQLGGIEDSTSVDKYKDLIQKNFSPTKVGDFLKDNILFTQYLIQDENRINCKLLFFNPKDQLIQFDYILQKDSYVLELKAIESSIGSIKLIS